MINFLKSLDKIKKKNSEIQRFFSIKKTQEYSININPKDNIKNILKLYFECNDVKTRIINLILKFRTNWIFSDEIDISISGEKESEILSEIIDSDEFYKKLNYILEMLELQDHVLIIFNKKENNIDFDIYDLYHFNYDIKEDGKIILYKENKEYILQDDDYLFLNYSYKKKFLNSVIAKCYSIIKKIEEIENDIRKINKIFVNQVPVFNFNDEYRIQSFIEFIKNNKYELGDSLLLLQNESFKFEKPDIANVESLFKEKLRLYQELSPLSGIPLFLLGFPELIGGGRATAQEYIELISASIKKNRLLFKKFIEKILRKILYLRNKYLFETNDIKTKISISIPETVNSIIFEMLNIINEMRINNLISEDTYLRLNNFIRNTEEEKIKLAEERNNLSKNELDILNKL